MKFDALRLLAFGPFQDLVVDLSACPSGLHVLYGDNAAGKSTTLRAVRGLLYGIPLDTPDAHRHRNQDLRIGATIRGASGPPLEIVRRKGRVRTLLDASGEAIDEAPLQRMLAGVGEEMFATVFGLDHEALRRGGDALLSGRGDVAESLFEAGSGAGGLHALLEELRAEADALWTPTATKRPLSEALSRFKEARRATGADALSHEAWAAQDSALVEIRADHARVEAERGALLLRQRWLLRAIHVRPFLAKRRQWAAERAALGPVAPLRENAAEERRQAQRELTTARATVARLDEQIEELERKLAALGSTDDVVAPVGTAETLSDRSVRLRATLDELGRRRVAAERLSDDVHQSAARIGAPANVPRLDLAAHARVRGRAADERSFTDRRADTERRLADSARRCEAHEGRRTTLGPARDVGPLDRAVARARKAAELGPRLAQARAEVAALDDAIAAAARGLAPWTGSVADATHLVPPDAATLARFDQELEGIAQAQRERALERERARARGVTADEQIAALVGEGNVPAESDLDQARARRNESWRRVRTAWSSGKRSVEGDLGPAHERLVADADEQADRLRREAARVTRLAALRAERDASQREEAHADAAAQALEARGQGTLERWRTSWAPLGLTPLPPAEMRSWLARHTELVERSAVRAERAREIEALEARQRTALSQLQAALTAVGAAPPSGDPPLEVLIDEAAARVELERDRARQLATLDEQLADARATLQDLQAERSAQDLERAAWQRDWAEVTRALGLGGDASGDAALDVLGALKDLWARQDAAAAATRSADEIAAVAAALEDDLRTAVHEHAPDLAVLEIPDAVRTLVDRLKSAGDRARDRAAVAQARAERQDELHGARAQAADATRRLDALLTAAGVADLEALERAEQKWASAAELDARLADNAAQLLEVGEGASVDELEVTFAGLDADRLGAELEALEARLPDLEEQARDLDYRARGVEAGRQLFPTELKVVHVSEDAQAHRARVRELAHRYVRLKLAGVVLSREIEAYRDKNQGPVLARASELFRRLTAPEFQGLRVGWSAAEQDRLECIRTSGQVLEVGELSDGQRDALYLALRLASLERALTTCEPVPLILDDVLIHMDDRHVRAALEVLAEVARQTQVLFFTHNEHIVEIARTALAEARVCVHRLASP